MAAVAPAHWTSWMVAFMAETLGAGGAGEERGRGPCTAEERALGETLEAAWRAWGYNASREAFLCAPHAFLGVIPLAVLAYVRALSLYERNPKGAFLVQAAGLALFVAEVVAYREVIDPFSLFPQMTGLNVVARLPPRDGNPPAQRLIVSAHQDSAYEFNVFYYAAPYAALFMAAAAACSALMLFATGLAFVPGALAAKLRRGAWPLLALGQLLLLPCALWHFNTPVPGAGDDLSGIAVMHAFGGQLAAARAAAPGAPGFEALAPLLARTEVVLLATSSEEAGLRGAKRFVARHAAELAAVPTAAVLLESTHDAAWLSAIEAEHFTRARHDASLVAAAEAAAAAAGRAMHRVALPFGATDGSAFTAAGVAAVVLQAVDVRTLPPQYHTRGDVLATVAPDALAAQLSVLLNMAAAVGRGEWSGAPEALHDAPHAVPAPAPEGAAAEAEAEPALHTEL